MYNHLIAAVDGTTHSATADRTSENNETATNTRSVTMPLAPSLRLETLRHPPALTIASIVMLTCVGLRLGLYGNPDFHVDEEFYFVVADQMWNGAVPYVDVWDRKPIGLFLLYAALVPFSGDSMIAVQVAGTVFSVATAMVIWSLTWRNLGRWGALMPALLYIAWLGPFGGQNGQSPVFYNFFMAVGFWLLFRAYREPARSLTLAGVQIMSLVGLSIQTKYTPVFPGMAFGIALMLIDWSRARDLKRLCIKASLWIAAALLPTALAMVYYLAIGHLGDFVWANFTSIFYRQSLDAPFRYGLIFYIVVRASPLILLAVAGVVAMRSRVGWTGEQALQLAWLGGTFIEFVAVGNFYDHYALPLIAPLVIVGSWLFRRERIIRYAAFLAVFIAGVGAYNPTLSLEHKARSRQAIFGLAETARPYLRHGCLFIFDGPSILYRVTRACTLTPFLYPDHLSNSVETDALGVDSVAEMRRVLDARPAVLVTTTRGLIPAWNGPNRRLIDAAIARDYRLVDHALEGFGSRYYLLYARRDLVSPGTPELSPPSQAHLERMLKRHEIR